MRARLRQREKSQRGVTLVELLVTVAIMGIAMTAMMATLFATVANSSTNRRLAVADTELRRYADKLHAADYESCADEAQYRAAIVTEAEPAGVVVAIDAVMFWDGADPLDQNFVSWAAAGCTAVGEEDEFLQRVALTVSFDGATRSETVVKRYYQ